MFLAQFAQHRRGVSGRSRRRHTARLEGSSTQARQRFLEGDVFDLHHELEYIAARATAEAVPALVVGVNDQGWCGAVRVERTKPAQIPPCAFEFDVRPDDLVNRVARANAFDFVAMGGVFGWA